MAYRMMYRRWGFPDSILYDSQRVGFGRFNPIRKGRDDSLVRSRNREVIEADSLGLAFVATVFAMQLAVFGEPAVVADYHGFTPNQTAMRQAMLNTHSGRPIPCSKDQ